MKRLHFMVSLFFISFWSCATPETSTHLVEISPAGTGLLIPSPSVPSGVLPPMAPPSSSIAVSTDNWTKGLQIMGESILSQTDEINSLKLRIAILEAQVKKNEMDDLKLRVKIIEGQLRENNSDDLKLRIGIIESKLKDKGN